MATDQQFCLRWNNHQSTLISVFDTLLENGTLVDCTLAAEGQYMKAHKVVLSACSPYFEILMSQHYEKHPILILKDVKFQELKAMIDYMYRGEVNISQDQLGTFLKAAESLQIKGLSDGGGGESDARDVGSTSTTPKRTEPVRKVPPPSPAMPQPRAERRPADVTSPIPPSDGSISPTLRKRRRIRRSSQGDDSNDLDSASNASDMQSTPVPSSAVPSIPAPMTPVVPSTSSTITKPEQTESLSRLDNSNSLPPESGLIKAKMEPVSEGLLEPKAECPDYLNNENSIEDLTLDDDDEMEMSNMASTSQGSDQGFLPWQMGGNQSGSEQVFMGSQEGLAGQGQRGDSQGVSSSDQTSAHPVWPPEVKMLIKSENTFSSSNMYQSFSNPRKIQKSFQEALLTLHSLGLNTKKLPAPGEPTWPCIGCGKIYRSKTSLTLHRRVECGKEPTLKCQYCLRMFHHNSSLLRHIRVIHRDILAMMARNQTI